MKGASKKNEMATLWETIEPGPNFINLLQSSRINPQINKTLKKNYHFTFNFLKRLGLQHQLEGHDGCVNCLQWSDDGRVLASGSDDTNIILWDPFRKKKLSHISTRHRGNIFSVKFIGDGSLIATGAGDSRVIVQSIHRESNRTPLLDCGCHITRVKRLATAPDQPQLFWSASEDGLVLQYDMREPHECMTNSKVFVDLSQTNELKCIAVNPTRPHLVAVGANDAFVRLYDRRMVKVKKYRNTHSLDALKRNPPEPMDSGCVQYYSPLYLARDSGIPDPYYKISVTYVSFNAAGTEMLANVGGDHVYLFDLINSRTTDHLKKPADYFMPNSETSTVFKPCCIEGDEVNYGLKEMTSNFPFKHNYKLDLKDEDCICSYMDRATRQQHRKWPGDSYSALRDYLSILKRFPAFEKGYFGVQECMLMMKWEEELEIWLKHCETILPKQKVACDYFRTEMKNQLNNKEPYSHLMHPEILSPKFEISDTEKQLRENAFDYDLRFLGHCNTTTDIKEANFLGEDGQFICAGSDDGVIYIWDRKTTNLITALVGDFSIVNCVQPHPSACFLASSGIDPVVKIWSPLPENIKNRNRLKDPWTAIEENQRRILNDPLGTMIQAMESQLRNASPTSLEEMTACRTS